MTDQIQQAYKNDFERFLAHTDEKQVLLNEIVREIEKIQAGSLLDIGAGNGLLSIPLSTHVARYVAIEPKDSFVEKLRAAGLTTIHDSFPVSIEGTFDMVLSSHSLSYSQGSFEPYVRAAWELVAHGGQLLIVTYRGQEDDWTDLMKDLGESPTDKNRIGYNTLIMLLNSLGEVKTRKVKTAVRTDSLEDMIEALSFVASDGVAQKKDIFMQKRDKLVKLLAKYKTSDTYEFPFWHYFVSTSKL